MESKKFKISLQVKLLLMVLTIVIVSTTVVSFVAYNKFSTSLTISVDQKLSEISNNVSHQISAVNEREFEKIRTLSKVPFIRDPNNSLEEKQNMLTSILKDLKGNYENLAFYDSDGNAITENVIMHPITKKTKDHQYQHTGHSFLFLFLAYSVINGLTLSVIFYIYDIITVNK